jgi:hypothetical protein
MLFWFCSISQMESAFLGLLAISYQTKIEQGLHFDRGAGLGQRNIA